MVELLNSLWKKNSSVSVNKFVCQLFGDQKSSAAIRVKYEWSRRSYGGDNDDVVQKTSNLNSGKSGLILAG